MGREGKESEKKREARVREKQIDTERDRGIEGWSKGERRKEGREKEREGGRNREGWGG